MSTIILPIVIQCTGYVKLNNDTTINNATIINVHDVKDIKDNFQLNDVAQETLLSFLKADNLFLKQITSMYPNFFEELKTKLNQLQQIEGEEAIYVEMNQTYKRDVKYCHYLNQLLNGNKSSMGNFW